jgi:hypothetical protein
VRGSVRDRHREVDELLLQVPEIHRLRDELEGPKFGGPTSTFVVTIGGDHHHRHAGEPLLDLRQQLQPIHARHVDVGQDHDQRRLDAVVELP